MHSAQFIIVLFDESLNGFGFFDFLIFKWNICHNIAFLSHWRRLDLKNSFYCKLDSERIKKGVQLSMGCPNENGAFNRFFEEDPVVMLLGFDNLWITRSKQRLKDSFLSQSLRDKRVPACRIFFYNFPARKADFTAALGAPHSPSRASPQGGLKM